MGDRRGANRPRRIARRKLSVLGDNLTDGIFRLAPIPILFRNPEFCRKANWSATRRRIYIVVGKFANCPDFHDLRCAERIRDAYRLSSPDRPAFIRTVMQDREFVPNSEIRPHRFNRTQSPPAEFHRRRGDVFAVAIHAI